ncbi:nitrite reductase [NAD(P)H] large subunit [Proteus mirabilis]|uniref:Nitrite reductase [NAD(P)H] large subunit n=1 Tax=Proteus mirabilis TaxID=584 RepID=A0A379GHD8_PROMI|nr:nitrite reductase [NAD(P)H] large subunit [Proteus mirabilis]
MAVKFVNRPSALCWLSCWNDYILRDDLVALQDTNDNFLANLQKDGTYSIIPRSPGGEITPAGIIAIGTNCTRIQFIHQNHRLSTYGDVWCTEADLPAIWQKLNCRGF